MSQLRFTIEWLAYSHTLYLSIHGIPARTIGQNNSMSHMDNYFFSYPIL